MLGDHSDRYDYCSIILRKLVVSYDFVMQSQDKQLSFCTLKRHRETFVRIDFVGYSTRFRGC